MMNTPAIRDRFREREAAIRDWHMEREAEDADRHEFLFELYRHSDRRKGEALPEAYSIVTARRKWWREVRETAAALRAQGIRCDIEERRGFFKRNFVFRCDGAALPILHELGDRMFNDWIGAS